ncbi:MAG: DinB family protein [Acidobacteriota bacterium]|nr:DinB family protein [Acidobacteriota bacterium]
MRWFEREFALGLPQWMLPNVIERLRGTPARLEELTRGLPPEVLTRRDGDRWSINEHAGHLLDLGWLDAARVEDYRAGRDALTPADLQNRKTHEARHNERAFADILADFRRGRGEFVRNLEAFDDETASRSALHPRLNKPMRVVDFAFFVAEHDDHHLAAISELIRKFAR